jgi:hypothetical protein
MTTLTSGSTALSVPVGRDPLEGDQPLAAPQQEENVGARASLGIRIHDPVTSVLGRAKATDGPDSAVGLSRDVAASP